jgi:hypothetical protein
LLIQSAAAKLSASDHQPTDRRFMLPVAQKLIHRIFRPSVLFKPFDRHF